MNINETLAHALYNLLYFLILSPTLFYTESLQKTTGITSEGQVTSYGSQNWIENDIFWNELIDNNYTTSILDQPNLTTSGKSIVELSSGCGKPFNMIAKLSDGTKVCFRYRPNLEQIQGEMFSYYLGRLLGIRNLVNTKLLRFSQGDLFWRPAYQHLVNTSWEEGHLVVMTHYEEMAKSVYVPKLILEDSFTLTRGQLKNGEAGLQDIMQLLQWSELTIFDYLIGNFDRVVSSMYNQQWHTNSMKEPINNLIRGQNELLLFIDNEDGLLHAYRLIDKYEPYLRKTIDNFCIFRRQTVQKLSHLVALSDEQLWSFIWEKVYRDNQKYYMYLPQMPDRYRKILKSRLNFVASHIRKCRSLSKKGDSSKSL